VLEMPGICSVTASCNASALLAGPHSSVCASKGNEN